MCPACRAPVAGDPVPSLPGVVAARGLVRPTALTSVDVPQLRPQLRQRRDHASAEEDRGVFSRAWRSARRSGGRPRATRNAGRQIFSSPLMRRTTEPSCPRGPQKPYWLCPLMARGKPVGGTVEVDRRRLAVVAREEGDLRRGPPAAAAGRPRRPEGRRSRHPTMSANSWGSSLWARVSVGVGFGVEDADVVGQHRRIEDRHGQRRRHRAEAGRRRQVDGAHGA